VVHEVEEEERLRTNEGVFKFLYNIVEIYDRRTMFLVAMQYINEGGSVMLALTCTLFFLHKKVEPYDATIYLCFIVSPEAFSFFWGMFADSVKIYGRRGHIILAALLQIGASITMLVLSEDTSNYEFIAVATLVVCGKAWLTPVIEGLMINQMKRDPERGAEDLETFGVLC
jgi:Na+/melibiose symporter-like transporter